MSWLRRLAVLLALLPAGFVAAQDAPDPSDVEALFEEHCTLCHAGQGAPVGLRLDDLDAALAGSDRGPVIVPGDPEASELIARLRGTRQPRMPLTGPPYLNERQIASVAAWIAAGAPTSAGAAQDGGGDDAAPGDDPEQAPEADAAPPEPGSYADVGPLFEARCAYCHRPDGAMGAAPEGLVLTGYASILGSTERPVVVPGSPLASELYRRVAGLSLPRMPFDGPPFLTDEEIGRIRVWIEAGAVGPNGAAAAVPVGAEVRLQGTLDGRWSLDGLGLVVTKGTRLDDAPGPGDVVEVRGVVTEDGRVRATRIRPR